MEGVLRRKAAAIVQHKGGWYGITFVTRGREIAELNLYSDLNLIDLRKIVAGYNYTMALENGSAFLFELTFPFSDKSKIRLVIGNELEERIPVSVDDMEISFVLSGKGRVLASALTKTLASELREDRHLQSTTIQGLAALYALRWFRLIPREDFVFVHMNGNAVLVMAYKEDNLYSLRQFFRSPDSNSLMEVFESIVSDEEFHPASFIMIGDNEDLDHERERLERRFGIAIQTPSLQQTLENEDIPEWSWPGIGAALMSLGTGGQLNLTGKRNGHPLLSSGTGVYASAALACIGVLACGLSYFDYAMKKNTYTYLASEPARIYKTVFPKSPPIRDPVFAMDQKIKALEKQPGSVDSIANPLAMLNEISRRIPADIDVKVNEFSMDEKEFTLSGTTVSFAVLEKIQAGLEQMKDTPQIEAQNLELTGNRQVKFRLRGKI
jgi:hypothetical protein